MIIAIVIAGIFALITLYCCLRCCGFCGGRRGRRTRRSTQPSMFNPMPYQGYQPAHNPGGAPPAYNEPARFAQFDSHGFTRSSKTTEDSLPAMPSWDTAQSKRIEDKEAHSTDVELGHIDAQQKLPMMSNASTLDLSRPPAQTHSRNPSEMYTGPNFHVTPPPAWGHNKTESTTSYTGPDFGVNTTSHNNTADTAYTGPDFSTPKSYTAFTPATTNTSSGSPQENGTTSNNQPPGALQAGRRI